MKLMKTKVLSILFAAVFVFSVSAWAVGTNMTTIKGKLNGIAGNPDDAIVAIHIDGVRYELDGSDPEMGDVHGGFYKLLHDQAVWGPSKNIVELRGFYNTQGTFNVESVTIHGNDKGRCGGARC